MAKLPFAIEPRLKPIIEKIGDEASGIIEIERRGYLTSGERSFVQQIQTQDDATLNLIGLSRKISKEKGIGLDKAYQLVVDIMTGGANDALSIQVESEFAEEIQTAINKLTTSRLRDEIIMASALLMYRVNSELTIEDVMEIHPDIINGLAELYRDEEMKSIEKLKASRKKANQKEDDGVILDVEEIEKKPKEVKNT